MKKWIAVVVVLAFLILTSKPNRVEPPQAEKVIQDPTMPRSRSIFSMETGDAEYLALVEKAEKKRNATELKTVDAAAGDTEVVSIGIHGEEVQKEYKPGCLTASLGVFNGPSGREKWYNLPMEGVVKIMRGMGYDEMFYPYWVREDGVKMLGDYVMVAANIEVRPKGTVLETSLGRGLVCDACMEANGEPTLIDIAVAW